MNFISASRTSSGIQSFAQMIDHLHLKNRRLPLKDQKDHLVGEVNSLDRMRPGSFATYEMHRPFLASQVSVTANIATKYLSIHFILEDYAAFATIV